MIALAGDHAGFPLKTKIASYLDELKVEYKDFGTFNEESCDYTRFALTAAKAVMSGECDKGILVCGTGIGISISANKVRGIRCAVCGEPFTAMLSRLHNDANMLALGARVVGEGAAKLIVKTWLETGFEGGRHAERVAGIHEIESAAPTGNM